MHETLALMVICAIIAGDFWLSLRAQGGYFTAYRYPSFATK